MADKKQPMREPAKRAIDAGVLMSHRRFSLNPYD
jgi:hypothetical protein